MTCSGGCLLLNMSFPPLSIMVGPLTFWVVHLGWITPVAALGSSTLTIVATFGLAQLSITPPKTGLNQAPDGPGWGLFCPV